MRNNSTHHPSQAPTPIVGNDQLSCGLVCSGLPCKCCPTVMEMGGSAGMMCYGARGGGKAANIPGENSPLHPPCLLIWDEVTPKVLLTDLASGPTSSFRPRQLKRKALPAAPAQKWGSAPNQAPLLMGKSQAEALPVILD